jgi:hypothetical protein
MDSSRNCYRWIISLAIASQIVQLANPFSPPASPFSLHRRVNRISRPLRQYGSNSNFAVGKPASSFDPVDLSDDNNSTYVAEQHVSQVLVPLRVEDTPAHEHMTKKDQVLLSIAITGAILAFAGLISISGAGAWRYFLAGGICAATSHAIPVPIDVVKTRIQLYPKLADKPFMEATRSIIEEEGIRALWVGLGPTVWGCKSERALPFE